MVRSHVFYRQITVLALNTYSSSLLDLHQSRHLSHSTNIIFSPARMGSSSAPGPSAWHDYEPSNDPDDLPPPYTENANVSSIPQPSHNSSSTVSHTHGARLTDPSQPDEVVLSASERELFRRVSSYVEDFLGKVGLRSTSDRPGSSTYRADLYLVPEEAIPAGEDWQLSGADYLKQSCNHLELTRVTNSGNEGHRGAKCACGCLSPHQEKQGHDMNSEGQSGLSEDMWWRSEDQAKWLAEYLGQKLQSHPPSSSVVDKCSHPGDEKTCSCACHRSNTKLRLPSSAGGVQATVRVEEMAFRMENEMGLWESKSGWTIIVSASTR